MCRARPRLFLNELVAAGTTKDAKLEFLLSDVPKKVELVFRYGAGDPARVRFESGVSIHLNPAPIRTST